MNPGTGCLYVFGGKSAEAGEDQVISSVCLPTWKTVIYRTSNAAKRASQIKAPREISNFQNPPRRLRTFGSSVVGHSSHVLCIGWVFCRGETHTAESETS